MSETSQYRIQSGTTELRLQTIVRLRWMAVVGQIFTIVFVYFVLGFNMPIGFCLAFVAISAWFNIFLRLQYPARHRLGAEFASALLSYDIIQLGALLYLTGGIQNPFSFLLIAPVVVSAATLPPINTVLLGLISVSVSTFLVFLYQPIPWSAGDALELPLAYRLGIWSAVFASLVFIALYAWRLSKEARLMSDALAATELVLAREQKLHALDGLAAAAAHELGTPLSTISVVAKELERDLTDTTPSIAEDIALIRSQAARCRDILKTLTHKSEEEDPLFGTSTISQLITEAAEPHMVFDTELRIDAKPAQTALGIARGEPKLERAPGVIYGLGNLIENAVDFADEGVDIIARWDANTVEVRVIDDGTGFPTQILHSLGEPYVTMRNRGDSKAGPRTSPAGTGMGLGFFIAKTLLERSGAELALANAEFPKRGAIVTVRWPRDVFHAPSRLEPGTEAGAKPDIEASHQPSGTIKISKPATN